MNNSERCSFRLRSSCCVPMPAFLSASRVASFSKHSHSVCPSSSRLLPMRVGAVMKPAIRKSRLQVRHDDSAPRPGCESRGGDNQPTYREIGRLGFEPASSSNAVVPVQVRVTVMAATPLLSASHQAGEETGSGFIGARDNDRVRRLLNNRPRAAQRKPLRCSTTKTLNPRFKKQPPANHHRYLLFLLVLAEAANKQEQLLQPIQTRNQTKSSRSMHHEGNFCCDFEAATEQLR